MLDAGMTIGAHTDGHSILGAVSFGRATVEAAGSKRAKRRLRPRLAS